MHPHWLSVISVFTLPEMLSAFFSSGKFYKVARKTHPAFSDVFKCNTVVITAAEAHVEDACHELCS